MIVGAPNLYQLTGASYLEQQDPAIAADVPEEFVIEEISQIQRYLYPFGSLIWASIFSVKFCYLYFFRLLIDRQKSMIVYWRAAMVITFVSAVFDICGSFESCPELGANSLQCEDKYYTDRRLGVEIVTIVLDIVTDLMSTSRLLLFFSPAWNAKTDPKISVLAIPPYLMSKVSLRPRQKLGISFFLSLSLMMILIAVVRISRVRASDFEIWATFWQQLEGCIAVLMISLTAFRTVFVAHKTRNSPVSPPGHNRRRGGSSSGGSSNVSGSKWKFGSYYSSMLRRLFTSSTSSSRSSSEKGVQPQPRGPSDPNTSSTSAEKKEVHMDLDISIPDATLTGMRTVIGRSDGDVDESMPWPLPQDPSYPGTWYSHHSQAETDVDVDADVEDLEKGMHDKEEGRRHSRSESAATTRTLATEGSGSVSVSVSKSRDGEVDPRDFI